MSDPLEQQQLHKLNLASILESVSLLVLLFFAVPLKHLAGLPQVVSIIGPIHGLTFLFYLWTVIETVSGDTWTRAEISRLVLVAFIPFGGFANLGWLQRRMDATRGEVG